MYIIRAPVVCHFGYPFDPFLAVPASWPVVGDCVPAGVYIRARMSDRVTVRVRIAS